MSKKVGSEKGKCLLPYTLLLGRRCLTLHQSVTNNSLQRLALALIILQLLGWRWLCFPDDVVLVSGSHVWDTGALTQSATAQGIAVDDTDEYAKGIPHFSPLETILKISSFKGHQILNCFISLLHLSSFDFYLPSRSHFIYFYVAPVTYHTPSYASQFLPLPSTLTKQLLFRPLLSTVPLMRPTHAPGHAFPLATSFFS